MHGGERIICKRPMTRKELAHGKDKQANTFFEEKPDLVTRSQEIVISNVITIALSSRELCHWVVFQTEIGKHLLRFVEETRGSLTVECILND